VRVLQRHRVEQYLTHIGIENLEQIEYKFRLIIISARQFFSAEFSAHLSFVA